MRGHTHQRRQPSGLLRAPSACGLPTNVLPAYMPCSASPRSHCFCIVRSESYALHNTFTSNLKRFSATTGTARIQLLKTVARRRWSRTPPSRRTSVALRSVQHPTDGPIHSSINGTHCGCRCFCWPSSRATHRLAIETSRAQFVLGPDVLFDPSPRCHQHPNHSVATPTYL